MHNIKDIRKDPENFSKLLKTRIQKESLTNEYLSLDEKIRSLIKNKELLEHEKKKISKSNDKSLFNKSKELSIEISNLEKKILENKTTLNNFLSELPNLPLKSVPVGKDENSNIVVYEKGSISKFDFKPKSHEVIGKSLNMIDFDLIDVPYTNDYLINQEPDPQILIDSGKEDWWDLRFDCCLHLFFL